MTATLLNFTQRLELELHAEVVADVQTVAMELNVPTMLTGAFARDLLPMILDAANRFEQRPDDAAMRELMAARAVTPIFGIAT